MSSLQRVTDPAAVRLLLSARAREVLGLFLHAENTVSAAARTLGADLRRVHRTVRALYTAGLLLETRLEPRAGRPVRHYRASAPGYFVPRALTRGADFAERFEEQFLPTDRLLARALGREFERAVHEQGRGREWGMRLYWDGQRVQTDESYRDAELRGVPTGWQGPQLTAFNGLAAGPLLPAEAAQVQRELIGVVKRLGALFEVNRAAGRGQPFALRAVLAPLTEEELKTLRP